MQPTFLVQHIAKDAVPQISLQKGPRPIDRVGSFLQGSISVLGPEVMNLDAVHGSTVFQLGTHARRTAGTTEQNDYGQQLLIQYHSLKLEQKKEPHPKVQLKVMKFITFLIPLGWRGHRGIPIIAFRGHGMEQVFVLHNITLGAGGHEHIHTHGQKDRIHFFHLYEFLSLTKGRPSGKSQGKHKDQAATHELWSTRRFWKVDPGSGPQGYFPTNPWGRVQESRKGEFSGKGHSGDPWHLSPSGTK